MRFHIDPLRSEKDAVDRRHQLLSNGAWHCRRRDVQHSVKGQIYFFSQDLVKKEIITITLSGVVSPTMLAASSVVLSLPENSFWMESRLRELSR